MPLSPPFPSPEASPAVSPASPRGRRLAVAVVVLAFAVPAGAMVGLGIDLGPQFGDERLYHWPTVERFAARWPAVDFRSYPAAMTPGYHLLMAGVVRAGGGLTAARAATLLLTAGLLATLAAWVARRARPADAVLLCLPFAWSQYVFPSGAYAVPHNPAWWGVLGLLLLALRPAFDRWSVVAGGALLWATVMVRQVHAWAALPLVAGAWAGSGDRDDGEFPARLKRVAAVAVACLPAALTLAYFARLWGGLTPKAEQDWVRSAGPALAPLTMMLATAGAAGAFFLPALLPAARRRRPGGRWAAAAAAGGLMAAAVAAAGPTGYDMAAGRWGGLWNLGLVTPTVGGRNVAVVALATLGGAAIAAALAAVGRRDRLVLAAAAVGFAAAHVVVNQAWQRYYEPMVLIGFILAAGAAAAAAAAAARGGLEGPDAPTGLTRLARAGLAALALVQAALTIYSLK